MYFFDTRFFDSINRLTPEAILTMKIRRIYTAINWNSFNQLNEQEFIAFVETNR